MVAFSLLLTDPGKFVTSVDMQSFAWSCCFIMETIASNVLRFIHTSASPKSSSVGKVSLFERART